MDFNKTDILQEGITLSFFPIEASPVPPIDIPFVIAHRLAQAGLIHVVFSLTADALVGKSGLSICRYTLNLTRVLPLNLFESENLDQLTIYSTAVEIEARPIVKMNLKAKIKTFLSN